MIVKFNGTKYPLECSNETGKSLKAKVSLLLDINVRSIRLIQDGYPVVDESIVASNAIVYCVLQMW
jgi:hypothetical protein